MIFIFSQKIKDSELNIKDQCILRKLSQSTYLKELNENDNSLIQMETCNYHKLFYNIGEKVIL